MDDEWENADCAVSCVMQTKLPTIQTSTKPCQSLPRTQRPREHLFNRCKASSSETRRVPKRPRPVKNHRHVKKRLTAGKELCYFGFVSRRGKIPMYFSKDWLDLMRACGCPPDDWWGDPPHFSLLPKAPGPKTAGGSFFPHYCMTERTHAMKPNTTTPTFSRPPASRPTTTILRRDEREGDFPHYRRGVRQGAAQNKGAQR